MAEINLNTTYKMNLSLESIDEFKEILAKNKKRFPSMAKKIIKLVSEIGLKNNYKSTELLPIIEENGVISGGIHTTDPIDTYREFGTGIVGSEKPHPDVMSGWIYDVNEHGKKGWIYPKGDGSFGWTAGLPAEKKFYEAIRRMEDSLPKVSKDEFSK